MPFSFAVERLCYAHADGTPLFADLAFNCPPGIHGLVGASGSGKTTLLRLLARELRPNSGTVTVPERTLLVPQIEEPAPDATVGDALAPLEEFEARRSAAKLTLAVPPFERGANTLSGGEWMQLRILRALLNEPDWILLDEPTTHLDTRARSALRSALSNSRANVLIATHDRDLLSMVEAVYELSATGMKRYGGNYAFYAQTRENEDRAAAQKALDAGKELTQQRRRRQRAYEQAEHRASAGKRHAVQSNLPKVMRGALQRKAQNTTAALSTMHDSRIGELERRAASAREKVRSLPELDLDVPSARVARGKFVVAIDAFSPSFAGSRRLFDPPLRLWIAGPERIGVTGDNGSGKTLVLREIAARASVPCAYLDQRLDVLPRAGTLAGMLRDRAPKLAEHERRIRLARFGFTQERGLARLETLSGGERMRAALLLLFAGEAPPQLLLLDEPETHLDLHAVRELTAALNTFTGAMVVVSHDETFLAELRLQRTINLGRKEKEPLT